jgi:hypothetical protein
LTGAVDFNIKTVMPKDGQPPSIFGCFVNESSAWGRSRSKNTALGTVSKIFWGLAAMGLAYSSFAEDHYVSPFGSNISPYTDWATAARNIQDAINAASAGDTVWVTNGTYSSGGKVMAGVLTNIVALNKPILLQSINGPSVTTILGSKSAFPAYARCAWVTNDAVLSGFTLRSGGAFSPNNVTPALLAGGGVWCSSLTSIVTNCWITSCTAYSNGGGVYGGTLKSCVISGNYSQASAHGVCASVLNNSLVVSNGFLGSPCYATCYCVLTNCTVAFNESSYPLEASSRDLLVNCIVFANPWWYTPGHNYIASTFLYSCSTPLPAGVGNIGDDPQFVDTFHIASTSPCRGAANPLYSTGIDLDGEDWAAAPSMGCDEVWEDAIRGPLSVRAAEYCSAIAQTSGTFLNGYVTGRTTRVGWDFGDGTGVTNASYLNEFHSWAIPGDYTVTFTAYNADHPDGVSTNLPIYILPLVQPAITSGGFTSNGFVLSFPTQPGPTYYVEQTTNLIPPITWRTVTRVFPSCTTNVLYVTDAAATNAARFYRVHVQPLVP